MRMILKNGQYKLVREHLFGVKYGTLDGIEAAVEKASRHMEKEKGKLLLHALEKFTEGDPWHKDDVTSIVCGDKETFHFKGVPIIEFYELETVTGPCDELPEPQHIITCKYRALI